MILRKLFLLSAAVASIVYLNGCKSDDPVKTEFLQLSGITAGVLPIATSGTPSTGIPVDQPFLLTFSAPVDPTTVASSISLRNASDLIETEFTFQNGFSVVSLKARQTLQENTTYTLVINSQLAGSKKEKFPGAEVNFKTTALPLILNTYSIGNVPVVNAARLIDIPLTVDIVLNFSAPLDPATVNANSVVLNGNNYSALVLTLANENKTLIITRPTALSYLSKYTLVLSGDIRGADGEVFSGLSRIFYSALGDHTSGLPALTDEQLLDKVQSQTLKYFYDYGHPSSGMARERLGSGNTVTTGGTGFGLMALVAGIDRGFIPRTDGVARFAKIVTFLEKADRFHGAWSHWVDGGTGKVIPFSSNDNGGDLVETSFLVEGLITVRQYLNASDTVGNNLINRITKLWTEVEWDWYRQESQKEWLYWHWSPDKAWVMNFALIGYFEEQITYILAASSPTHGIPKSVYVNGFAANGNSRNGATYRYNGESHVLPLGQPGPLFWTQYSYIGMDPHFSDDYADFWTQGVNASLINHAYCAENPQKFVGYSDSAWGLTASDNPSGYGAQSPVNDNGTLTPTAALSAFPYTPVESMKAMRFFYDKMGDRIWGDYGFVDAYNVTENWYATSYLAIDQGPIVGMIENYRSGLLWNLFMSAPEVQQGVSVLEFH